MPSSVETQVRIRITCEFPYTLQPEKLGVIFLVVNIIKHVFLLSLIIPFYLGRLSCDRVLAVLTKKSV